MASLKDVQMKIAGVRKTKQITKAMNMVASAKLRGTQTRTERFRAYADSFHEMLRDLSGAEHDVSHPLLEAREKIKTVGIVLATSDRGLCGSFNSNLINAALQLAAQHTAEGRTVQFYTVGRKGRDAVSKQGYTVAVDYSALGGSVDFHVADRLSVSLINAYLSGAIDEVVFVYSRFQNLMRQIPEQLHLLPIKADEAEDTPGTSAAEYTYEPKGEALMEALLPRVLKSFVYKGLLNTATSEHAARMTAMDNATRNCDDMIRSLTQLFNKTRQAAITSDLIDIVGGANALNG